MKLCIDVIEVKHIAVLLNLDKKIIKFILSYRVNVLALTYKTGYYILFRLPKFNQLFKTNIWHSCTNLFCLTFFKDCILFV